MLRAYAIRPYSIGSFRRQIDHNLGPSSHPRWVSCTLSEAEGESNPILVLFPDLGPSSHPEHPGSNQPPIQSRKLVPLEFHNWLEICAGFIKTRS